ncbi:MAG TPA: beta-N-acetylhexosaminidase, partial [Candidatus Avibacteroides faecavium]|nr:beta-N-acetylhexosaminidase [Candidatus Avibacteroides faecavium]
MRLKSKLLAIAMCAALVACGNKDVEADFNIVPLPNQITKLEGKPFVLSSNTTIVYPDNNPDIERIAGFLAGYIEEATGHKPETTTKQGENSIVLMSQLNTDNNEAYTIKVSEQNIVVNGATPAGTFYGVQTLRKAIPARAEGMDVKFGNVEISDQPRFGYRGMHLDVSRHFFTA